MTPLPHQHSTMATGKFITVLLLFLSLSSMGSANAAFHDKELYIVYMGSNKDIEPEIITAMHHDMLAFVTGSMTSAQDSIVYSYKHSFNGFSAMLSQDEYAAIADMPGVVSIFPNQNYKLHTTRTWEFVGLSPTEGAWPATNFGADVIVGTIDTGIWPEAESFKDDESLGPVPATWKGACEAGQNFTASLCNRKLIGARYFIKGYEAVFGPLTPACGDFRSARDADGHGTHTTSTMAGSLVRNVSLEGLARGDARGGAPNARVASYKACWQTCMGADMLAAFDEAVNDGVNILSVSLGGPVDNYFDDAIAIGSFHATEKGVFVACSAGNDGPAIGTVSNVAPWIMTVAASSIDRHFPSDIHLGNSVTYSGESINLMKLPRNSYPLVYGGDIPAKNVSSYEASFCNNGTLDSKKAKGRIVLCQLGQHPTRTVSKAGGVATILVAETVKTVAFIFSTPVTVVGYGVARDIRAYINSTRHPTALVTPTTTKIGGPAPLAAPFSSRGPNLLTPDIFKPDITAPGVDIFAAYSPFASPSDASLLDKRSFKYNIISGTSMSCPHAAGVAALVKAMHPHWSPSSIRSAMMTTATPLNTNNTQNVDWNLAWGSGQINPTAAMNPGLLYDTSVWDYVQFLCSIGYNQTLVQAVTNIMGVTCSNSVPSVNDLNYPSITASNLTGEVHVVRTVTNVGGPTSVYNVSVHHPAGVKVTVAPSTLSFGAVNQKLSFVVSLKPMHRSAGAFDKEWVFGALVWTDGVHTVRSPISVGPNYMGL